MDKVTDIWFRSALSLEDIVNALALSNAEYDSENYWEWVIGNFLRVTLDITRTHRKPPAETETRIFRPGNLSFSPKLTRKLVSRLQAAGIDTITCGRWVYRSGNGFDMIPTEVITADNH